MKPDLKTSFEYDGKHILADWYTVTRKEDIPNLAWGQVYAIASLNGLVPLVTNEHSSLKYNLPGGTTEPGETLEDTLRRELIEECNMRVLEWQPLGYQVLTDPDGTVTPQFRVYALVEKIGEFTNDPGGHVIANTLVPIDKVNEMIGYKDIGEIMVKLARPYFDKN